MFSAVALPRQFGDVEGVKRFLVDRWPLLADGARRESPDVQNVFEKGRVIIIIFLKEKGSFTFPPFFETENRGGVRNV